MKFKLVEQILDESYINILPGDRETKEQYIDTVWELMEKSYASIGGSLKAKSDLLKPNMFWKMVRKDGEIIACCCYKKDPAYGRKLVLSGNNMTPEGKEAMLKILQDDYRLTDRNSWMEVSDALEHILIDKKGETPLPNDVAEAVLNSIGKSILWKDPDGFHYTREIGGENHTKIMIGNPTQSSLDAGQDIEIPDNDLLNNVIDVTESKEYASKPLLIEDKVVKFNGKTYPNNGWCVIMMGAPGSGKSTVLNNLIPIDAKIYNPDYIKEFIVDKKHGEIEGNYLIFGGKKYSLDGIEPPYNLKNPEYVSYLHKITKPLNNKLKDRMFSMGIDADKGRLPNIAFDIAGSDIADLESIIFNLAPLGYKFCTVWVFNTLENVLNNNQNRSRTGLKRLVVQKYFDVLATIPQFMTRRDLVEKVNDFWIVLPVTYELQTPEGQLKYIKEDNVRKIDISGGVARLTSELTDMIFDNQAEILKKYSDKLDGGDEI